MKLEAGQVAVVTGAASGIGLALARRFSERGLRVVLADIEAPALETAAAGLSGGASASLAVPTDVSDAGAVRALAARTLEHFGRADVICNNAGIFAAAGPMWEIADGDWRWTLDVNLWGVIHGITTFVPHLVAQGSGHVLNTASMAGVATIPFIGPYTATKHAIVGLSESLQAELSRAAPGVGVTVLCPGQVATQIGRARRPGTDPRPPDPAATADSDGDGGDSDGDGDSSATAPGPVPSGTEQSADEVARRALESIEGRRLHDVPTPGSAALVRARLAALEADLDEASA